MSWPLPRACSLASSDDTWVSTVRTDRNRRGSDVGVRFPLAEQAEHLRLPGGNPLPGELAGDRRGRGPPPGDRASGVAEQAADPVPVRGRARRLVDVQGLTEPADPVLAPST